MLKRVVLILVIFGFTTVVVSAKKIVVPMDYPSITLALNNATPGDTIFVRNGVYKENITLLEGIVLQGEDKVNTIIDGRRRGPVIIAADNAVIENLTIRNGSPAGILSQNTSPIIRENIIKDNKGTGIMAIMVLPMIENNIIYDNTWSGIFCQGAKALNTAIIHNVIKRNGYSGIHLAYNSQVTVSSNIITNNHEYAIFGDESSSRSRIIYNNIFENYLGVANDVMLDPTNISSDPRFIDPKGWNYFVKEISASKKAGENQRDIGLVVMERVQHVPGVRDRDGDGIQDDQDLCPDIPGLSEFNGCANPDVDRDKICAPWVNDLNLGNRFTQICTGMDFCPDIHGRGAADGCPITDTDGDGVCDPWVSQEGLSAQYANVCTGTDRCVEVHGMGSPDGCPVERKKVTVIEEKMVFNNITFDVGSARITPESYPILDEVVEALKANSNVRIEVGGHTDSDGSRAANARLSLDRANAVREYFIQKGVDGLRIEARGYGEDSPVADNETPEGKAQNRRIEIKRLN